MDNSLFSLNNYNVHVIHWLFFLHVKCKESHVVIKLQMVSIKSREKAIFRASDKVQEKL